MAKVNDRQTGFVQGTIVLMADGTLKPIERIKPGDMVMSFNTRYVDSYLEPREVLDTFSYISRDVLEVRADDDSVMVAQGQLFLTPGMDWSFAHETASITDVDGNARSFDVIKVKTGNHKIYDIIVDENHSLVANGFKVHNGGGDDLGTTSRTGSVATSGGTPSASANRNTPTQGGTVDGPNPSNAGNMNSGYGGSDKSIARGSFGFAGDNEGPNTYGGGAGFNGGGGSDRRLPGINTRSIIGGFLGRRKKPSKPPPPPPPPPNYKVNAYAAYNAINETMGYICDIMVTYASSNYFTVRTSATTYTRYAEQIAKDALANIEKSDINGYDKGTLFSYHADILNTLENIRYAWNNPNETSVNITLLTRACLNVNFHVDRALGIISKYTGAEKTDIKYKLPGFTPPAKVYIPTLPTNPAYVKTASNTWMTTLPSPIGTTVTPGTTGGLGASYTRTRVVRGLLYQYNPGIGWRKIGPADQYRDLS